MKKEYDFIYDFITVGQLREMLSKLSDDAWITVTIGNAHPNHRIRGVEDSTDCGFWELRIEEEQ